MDDFDLEITNLFYALATGEISSPLQSLRYSEQLIEEPLHTSGRASTPPDIILFSKHYKHAFVIEIKDISNSDHFNENQARNYAAIDTESFRFALPNFRERPQLKFDVAYQGHEDNKNLLKTCIELEGHQFPVLVFDSQNLRIYKHPDAGDITFGRLKNILDIGIDIPLDSLSKVPKYVHFTPTSSDRNVASLVLTSLAVLSKLTKEGDKVYVSVRDITKQSHSKINIWSKLDRHYTDQLEAKVRNVLTILRQNGLGAYLKISGNEYWLDIFDQSGQPSTAKLGAIKSRISESGFVIDQVSLL